MKFNHKKLFDGVKERLDSTLSQVQVNGLEFLITSVERDATWKDVRHVAYALATTFHETAGSFQPVEEGYYLGSKTRVKAFQKTLRYYPYFGRGFVQLTWETKRIPNYSKASKALGVDFVKNPELVMNPEYAYKIMTLGMQEGWFTGKKLSDYIAGSKCDYANARRIINGMDKAGLIAGYAKSFEAILRASLSEAPAHNPAATIPPVVETSEPIIETPPNIITPTIEVQTVAAEPEHGIDSTITRWSARFIAVPAAAISFLGGIGSWLTSSPVMITVTLIVAGSVVAALYFGLKQIAAMRRDTAERKAKEQREERAFQVQMALITSAANPNQNTVKLIPPVADLSNSDAEVK